MRLHKLIMVNNECYKTGKTIVPQGIMVHSTGANNPYIGRYVGPDDGLLGPNQYGNHWNQPMSRRVCVHAFIGKLKDGSVATYQTLPWNHLAWHAGGSANSTHISFEICEDGLKDGVYFQKVYREAVELCVHLCKLFPTIDPENIIGHYEGHQRGMASNHGDPRNWFPKFGKSMDTFRADVKALLAGHEYVPPTNEEEERMKAGTKARVQTTYDEGLSLWSTTSKAQRMIRVPKGEIITVITDNGAGWVYAEYKGVKGFADKRYLVEVEEAPPVTPEPKPKPEPTPDYDALVKKAEEHLEQAIAILLGVIEDLRGGD